MTCETCNEPIPDGRLDFLLKEGKPITCLKCSKEEPVKAFLIYDHKTAGHAVVVPNNPDGTNNKESIRRAKEIYERYR